MAFKGVGRAFAKGVPFTFVWTGHSVTVAADDNRPMSIDYTHDVNTTVHRDGLSAVFAVSSDEPEHVITIRTVPVAPSTTNTIAGAKTTHTLPDILTNVTLANSPRAGFDGSWLYRGGGSISYTPDGAPEMSMTLYRYGNDVESPQSLTAVQAFS